MEFNSTSIDCLVSAKQVASHESGRDMGREPSVPRIFTDKWDNDLCMINYTETQTNIMIQAPKTTCYEIRGPGCYTSRSPTSSIRPAWHRGGSPLTDCIVCAWSHCSTGWIILCPHFTAKETES